MTLTELLSRLEQTGSRLDALEGKIALIKGRFRFWQGMAALGIGAAVVLFLAYLDARRRLEQCEKRNGLTA